MQILVQIVEFTLIGALVYGLCRLLRLEPVYPKIARPKRSALCALASVFASFLIMFVPMLIMLINHKLGPTQGVSPGVGHEHHQNLVNQLFGLFVIFLPMALMIRLNGEKLKSIGFTRTNLWKATVIGLFLVPTTLFFVNGGPSSAFKFTDSHNLHSLIYFSFVGFGEEILFRGYLQNRLVAWLGHYQGWILTSVVFSLVHVPQRVVAQGMSIPHALVSSLVLIPVGLLMGFVMLRTGSVVPGSLFHTFVNWMSRR